MNTPVKDGLWALTDKEKQTLRLIVRGHDAKSSARSLGLSVHTINERLRDARRKMAVSSSREAARMLMDAERDADSPDPDLFGDAGIGEDGRGLPLDQEAAPDGGVGRASRHPRFLIGVLLMTLLLGLLALTALPQAASTPPPATATGEAPNPAVVDTARHWLALLDQSRWEESYQGTTTSFRQLNTVQVWAAASEQARVPLGAMQSRTFVSEEAVPTPPHGYQMVKFHTRFAKGDTIETITLDREDGAWRVAGITLG